MAAALMENAPPLLEHQLASQAYETTDLIIVSGLLLLQFDSILTGNEPRNQSLQKLSTYSLNKKDREIDERRPRFGKKI